MEHLYDVDLLQAIHNQRSPAATSLPVKFARGNGFDVQIYPKMKNGSDKDIIKFSLKQKLHPRIEALKKRLASKPEIDNRVIIAESTINKLVLPKRFRDYHVLGIVQSISHYKDALTQQYFRWADTEKSIQTKP